MGHVDRGDPELALDRPDLLAQGDPDLGVEGRQRLVEEQDLRLDRERPGERDALLLAARQLARVAVALVGQVDQLEQLADPLADLVLRPLADLQAEADVVGDGHVREQRVRLEDHPDVALVRAAGW